MQASGQNSGVCVLVADDDPVSLRFLEMALRELGCAVCAVDSGDAALAAASTSSFDLLILDRRMPGLGAVAVLQALRLQGIATRAIATSAELDGFACAQLAAAGFALALSKPLRLEDLAAAIGNSSGHQPIRRAPGAISSHGDAAGSLLDDAAGLAAVGGERATLRALRLLLAQDLESIMRTKRPRDVDLVDELHRLRAACRYCGATMLGEFAALVEATTRAGSTVGDDAWADLITFCDKTRRAIDQDSSTG